MGKRKKGNCYLFQILSLLQSQAGGEETLLRLALKAADMALLLGAPLPPPNECLDLTVAASVLSTSLAQVINQSGSESGTVHATVPPLFLIYLPAIIHCLIFH